MKTINDWIKEQNDPKAEPFSSRERAMVDTMLNLTPHDWYCGCDHWNGCNLATCARCGRDPNGEKR